MTTLHLRITNIALFALVAFTFKSTTLFALSFDNKNKLLCNQPELLKIQASNEVPEIQSSNTETSELITISPTIKILMQKINTPNHLYDRYNMWLKKTAFKKLDQYFLIYTERSSGSGEFPIVMKSTDNYPIVSFAYQTGFENYDTPNQFGRYKVIFQFQSPTKNQLELRRYFCARPLFQ